MTSTDQKKAKTVFLGGSRAIREIPAKVKPRLHKMIQNKCKIIVGDARGADDTFQNWLNDNSCNDVTVYHTDEKPRNNKHNWPTEKIKAPSSNKTEKKDFSFFAAKDRAMAEKADYALMLWDGDSPGTVLNIYRLLNRNKPVVVWDSNKADFHELKTEESWKKFFNEIEERTYNLRGRIIRLGDKVEKEIKNEDDLLKKEAPPEQSAMF